MLYVLPVIALLIGLFLWWRWTSVGRGMRQRDERIMQVLDPIRDALAHGEDVSPQRVAEIAALPHTRPLLYEILKHCERLDLFPSDLKDIRAQGAGILAYWMMHPNELQYPPSEIDFVQACSRVIENESARFLVFRYRMPEGHWAGTDWLLGLSGPFVENDVPYSGLASAFSRCGDKHGELQPDELVDWFIGKATGGGA